MRKRFSAVQWAAWFREFDDSGLSVVEFCRQIGVSQNSFYVWRRKLQHAREQDQLFVPVVVQASSHVTIEFPCGAVVTVENRVDALRPVFETLVRTGGTQA